MAERDHGSTGGLLSKQAAENAYDSSMEAKVGALLAGTIGPGKAQVVVSSDLNTDQDELPVAGLFGQAGPAHDEQHQRNPRQQGGRKLADNRSA